MKKALSEDTEVNFDTVESTRIVQLPDIPLDKRIERAVENIAHLLTTINTIEIEAIDDGGGEHFC